VKDLTIPPAKSTILDRSHTEVSDIEQQYREGIITRTEKYNKVVDVWTKATNDVADAMMRELKYDTVPNPKHGHLLPRPSTPCAGMFLLPVKSAATASTRCS
jgi:DNA-directed RNA polymerase subunit beta'